MLVHVGRLHRHKSSIEQDKPFFLNGAEDSSCDSPAYTLLNDKT